MTPQLVDTGKVYSIKPEDRKGDFTFTRSSAATRVNADGNIEKETQNLLLQSNSFDTTWTNTSGATTGGQSGYDGGSDAWLITKTAAWAHLRQDITSSGVQTFSVYAKANASTWIGLVASTSGTDPLVYIDLANGTIGTQVSLIDATITDVGNGWKRVSMTFNASITRIRIYAAESNTAGGTSGSIYIQDAQIERGLVARDVITTTTAAVEGGITDNVPRLDYTDSSCPALLLEPQRTNLIPHSEYFGAWTKSAVTITANAEASPDGYTNADKLIATAVSGFHSMSQTIGSKIALTPYTFSFFAKADEIGFCVPNITTAFNGTQLAALINLSDGTASGVSAGLSVSTEDYGNGWYRIKLTATSQNNTSSFLVTINATNASGVSNFTGDGTSGILLYGAQLEAGSYATSYIPTYGTSVTRNGETCFNTNASSVIGQTEGTLYFEFDNKPLLAQARYFSLSDGTGSNRIDIYQVSTNNLGIYVATSGAAQVNVSDVLVPSSGTIKFALNYANNNYVWYLNGSQIGSDTNASVPILTDTLIGASSDALPRSEKNLVRQALLFKTRLSNEEAIALTTI